MFDPTIPKTFCYVNWDFPRGMRIESLSWDLTFHTEFADTPGLFVQLYDGPVNGIGKYFGFQTTIDGGLGRGLLYSRWETRDRRLARAGSGSLFYDSGHEGDFISVRKSYGWKKGSYRVEFQIVESGVDGVWYGLTCVDMATNSQVDVGSLFFPHGSGISNGCGTWLELYTTTFDPDNLLLVEFSIDRFLANGDTPPEAVPITYKPEEIPSRNTNVVLEPVRIIIRAGKGVQEKTPPGRHVR
jgi:hypothetical protein